MDELRGKVAVVTGGGSGIGEALARACAAEGMKVVLGDIEWTEAERVAEELSSTGAEAVAMAIDVRDPAAVEALAERTYATFGACHLLANNAGVAIFRRAAEMALADWQWVLQVNLMGVIHGVSAFLPRMREQGGPAHIVNTASIAGLISMGDSGLAAYVASKFGVVGLSEVLRTELAVDGIGVSVLCPGGVATRITQSERNRPDELRTREPENTSEPPPMPPPGEQASYGNILSPESVAQLVLAAVREDRLYVIPHPEWKSLVEERHSAIQAAFDAAADAGPR